MTLAAGAMAAPNPQTSTPVGSQPSDSAAVPGAAPGATPPTQCVSKNDGTRVDWAIYVDNNIMLPSNGQGKAGDNLYSTLQGDKKCKRIESWTCLPDTQKGAACTFSTQKRCTTDEMASNIYKATNKMVQVSCSGSKLTDLFGDDGTPISQYSATLGTPVLNMLQSWG